MPITVRRQHDDMCISVTGNATLPDLHIALLRCMTRSDGAEGPSVYVDVTHALIDAQRHEVEKFCDVMAQVWLVHMQDIDGRLVVCCAENPLANHASALTRRLTELAHKSDRLSVVTSFDAVSPGGPSSRLAKRLQRLVGGAAKVSRGRAAQPPKAA